MKKILSLGVAAAVVSLTAVLLLLLSLLHLTQMLLLQAKL